MAEAGVAELIALGAKALKPLRRADAFEADMACFYRHHLQCRLSFRLLREMASFGADIPVLRGIGFRGTPDPADLVGSAAQR